ncbi:MAG: hypothetical protein OXH70_06710 [Acidobacteria bacterium]|nr:hypothetical protein [Acidobacteriota bacterium]
MLEAVVGLLVLVVLLGGVSWVVGSFVARFLIRATADFLDAVESERRR